MDDNTAIVFAAAIATIPGVVAAVFGYLSVLQSRKNTAIMTDVQHQTNHLTESRVAAEKRIGEANAEVARHEGADAERSRGNDKAVAVAATAMQAIAIAAAAVPAQAMPATDAPTPDPDKKPEQ